MQRKQTELQQQQQQVSQQMDIFRRKQEEIDKIQKQQLDKLEAIAGYSREEAKKEMVELLKDEARSDAANLVPPPIWRPRKS